MKRSKKVALMLMVPVATLCITGCDNEQSEQALVFNSVEECSQSGLSTAEQCTNDWETAKSMHPSVAPKYNDKSQCEADFGVGHCEPLNNNSSSSVFMPVMAGFMAGNLLSRATTNRYTAPNYAQQSSSPNNYGGGSGGSYRGFTQPLYKSRNDSESFRTADDTPVARRSGLVSVKPSQVQPRASSGIVSRGGFGTQGAMRGGAGG